jgi:hypothetical protein
VRAANSEAGTVAGAGRLRAVGSVLVSQGGWCVWAQVMGLRWQRGGLEWTRGHPTQGRAVGGVVEGADV